MSDAENILKAMEAVSSKNLAIMERYAAAAEAQAVALQQIAALAFSASTIYTLGNLETEDAVTMIQKARKFAGQDK